MESRGRSDDACITLRQRALPLGDRGIGAGTLKFSALSDIAPIMGAYLLLGAGFSRNWGGWLASEVFEYLLGCPEVATNDELRRLLWRAQSRGGFEVALSDLQGEAESNASAKDILQRLESVVVGMFDEMNRGLEAGSWEFSNIVENSVSKFLTKFDAIFTLNQDLLLECRYLNSSPELHRPDRWVGVGMPGVHPGEPRASIVGQRWEILREDNFKIDGRIQPYFKLHGSSNWNAPDGSATLIMGGNKLGAIGGSPILAWYQREFEERLNSGDARLMIIGYGFRDQHINEVVVKAVLDRGLKMFVVAPEGAEIARAANSSGGAAIYAPSSLDDAFERGLLGASRRGLSEIFSGGSELTKLYRFLDS